MKNDRTKTIFYLNLQHVHKYGFAKFKPNPFSAQQTATKSVAEEQTNKQTNKKKSASP